MSISGQKSGKAPERSNFAQTCSLLSKFMKEKRSYGGDLSAEMTHHQLSTVNLLSNLENSPEINPKPEDGTNTSRKMSNNGAVAPMTIFYGGQVLVFNEFTADKANEIMTLARSANFNINKGNSPAAGNIIPDLNIASTPTTPTISSPQRLLPKSNGSDLPIARRNSLHRFLEKRKDRSAMRAPYQIYNNNNNNSPNHISKPEGSSTTSSQLELELFVQ